MTRQSCSASIVTMVLLGIAACETAPVERQAQDAEFVRGCWVQKSGSDRRVIAFLRLLPFEPASSMLNGGVQHYADGHVFAGNHFSFARDGSSVTMEVVTGNRTTHYDKLRQTTPEWLPPQRTARRLVFRSDAGLPYFLVVEGGEQNLRIAETSGITGDGLVFLAWFDGERDGCD